MLKKEEEVSQRAVPSITDGTEALRREVLVEHDLRDNVSRHTQVLARGALGHLRQQQGKFVRERSRPGHCHRQKLILVGGFTNQEAEILLGRDKINLQNPCKFQEFF